VTDAAGYDRRALRRKAMIAHRGLDEATLEQATEFVRRAERSSAGGPRLDGSRITDVRLERWDEGRVAHALHVGPCSERGDVLGALHEAIESAGYRPRGRQHEIHLNDLRRTPPAELRTLIRQPVDRA
jgi:hypothetical protein